MVSERHVPQLLVPSILPGVPKESLSKKGGAIAPCQLTPQWRGEKSLRTKGQSRTLWGSGVEVTFGEEGKREGCWSRASRVPTDELDHSTALKQNLGFILCKQG